MTNQPLSDLSLRRAYHKGRHSIAEDFFLPCMARATRYDRAVAFFRSSIYTIAWPSLRSFIQSGGYIRVICSPILAKDDDQSLRAGYRARNDEEEVQRLRQEIASMLEEPELEKPTRVLAALVAMRRLEFKIAHFREDTSPSDIRIFHNKLGIYQDKWQNSVVFKGSMNESWTGLARDGNLESVDVFASWRDASERERVNDEMEYFESLWNDTYPTVEVREFPEAAKQQLLKVAEPPEWEAILEEIEQALEAPSDVGLPKDPAKLSLQGLSPYPHQSEALLDWRNRGRRGLLWHATGSGKTFTAVCAMKYALAEEEIPIIVVPSTILFSQWKDEIQKFLPEASILKCGAGNTRWKKAGLLRKWSRSRGGRRVVLATVDTASSEKFLAMIQDGEHLFLVVDEVHTIGSPKRRKVMELQSGPRLGLSATPKRYGDQEGTGLIFEYFENVLEPRFDIFTAIKQERLVPYMYYPHGVALSEEEQKEWNDLTRQIAAAWSGGDDEAEGGSSGPSERAKRLLIKRANVAKEAQNKIPLAGKLLKKEFREGQRWIVYCNNMEQLQEVRLDLRDRNIDTLEYHYQMSGDPKETLRYFEAHSSVIVAIQCLDEGVDIPNASHALILASSKNPREFIQRRGRILRTYPGKHLAHIHDAIVVPSKPTGAKRSSVLEAELARAILFGRAAENPIGVAKLESLALEYGLNPSEVAEHGFEDE